MADTTTISTKSFDLEVISPERVLVRARVRSLQLATSDGQIGILAGHAPLVGAVVPCVLRAVGEDGKEMRFAVGEGFLEVVKDRVKVLVDSAERSNEIDVERAKKSHERAKDRLSRRNDKSIDAARAEAALARAVARLKATHTL